MGKPREDVPSDAELLQAVRAARRGDSAAIDLLIRTHSSPLRAYLQRKIGNRMSRFAEIDDLQQEVFASLVGELGRLREDATAEDFRRLMYLHAGWIMNKVARRAANFAGESIGGADAPRPQSESAMGDVTRRDVMGFLRDRIEQLGAEKSAVVLGILTGKTFEEIAAELGITVEAARKRYLRATEGLAQPDQDES